MARILSKCAFVLPFFVPLPCMDEFVGLIMHLPFNLYRTALDIRGELTRRLSTAFGQVFTADYWFVLEALSRNQAMEQAALSRMLNRDAASISRTISGMERINLVQRVKCTSGRCTSLQLTQIARDFWPKALEIVKITMRDKLNGLKPIEVVELNRMLLNIFEQNDG